MTVSINGVRNCVVSIFQGRFLLFVIFTPLFCRGTYILQICSLTLLSDPLILERADLVESNWLHDFKTKKIELSFLVTL